MALSEHKTHVRRDTLVRVVTPKPLTESPAARYVWALARLSLGWVFVWAFLDKLFGLGHATPAAKAWIEGGSPTGGFLKNSPTGPFAGFYHDLAGAAWADWLFMIGLGGIGAALVLGVGIRIAAAAGAVLLVMMWTAVLPPENNVFMDDHLIYAILIVGLALVSAGDTLGLGRWWGNTRLAKRLPILK
ncbi:thiosulfate dehydrogenase [quinone] large subunit [Actinomadura madurae]|uniref:Thiosulfate dehydrogenase [quinone] large subunit n=1 Tax=Actinomadura madurae TaxID=1993 RepID=A0A1I5PF62_9ACTN|nr:DoxX family membrane protein [Actinomadura madurae]SFP32719.1 thiosulfate dehydrogenase [quinone] large subunit [Actinomadura madurae]